MKLYWLRLVEDYPRSEAVLELGPAARALYVREGALELDAGAGAVPVAAGDARFSEGPLRLRATAPGTLLWRFELSRAAKGTTMEPSSGVKLTATVELDPADEYLFRCDRVDLPPGSVTPKHTHAGPGIRCVLTGDVHAEIGGERSFHAVGEAWFERGPDPVVGTMSQHEPTSFIRALILPATLRGKTSYRPWDENAAAQSVPAQYRVLVDQPFSLDSGRPSRGRS